jgi:toxin-antitoxin system PIN domain toxin
MLVDANLLVYAVDEDDPHHPRAHAWLTGALNGQESIGLAWESLTAFLRLVTNPRVRTRPLEPAEAWSFIEDWLEAGPTWIPQPTARHSSILAGLVATHRLGANLVPDAHLAAIAIGHGLTVASADTDFARFSAEVAWHNPLAA